MDEIKVEPEIAKKHSRTFKEYYDEDPAFMARHRAYIKVKVPCTVCGKASARYNMSAHKKTKKCQLKGQSVKSDKEKQFEEALALAMKMIMAKPVIL